MKILNFLLFLCLCLFDVSNCLYTINSYADYNSGNSFLVLNIENYEENTRIISAINAKDVNREDISDCGSKNTWKDIDKLDIIVSVRDNTSLYSMYFVTDYLQAAIRIKVGIYM
jgi:hypothetical protein